MHPLQAIARGGLCFMAAAVQPVRSGMSWERIEELSRQHLALSATARSLIQESRELRGISRTLRYANADLREFLQENTLNILSRCEHWQDRASELPD